MWMFLDIWFHGTQQMTDEQIRAAINVYTANVKVSKHKVSWIGLKQYGRVNKKTWGEIYTLQSIWDFLFSNSRRGGEVGACNECSSRAKRLNSAFFMEDLNLFSWLLRLVCSAWGERRSGLSKTLTAKFAAWSTC